MACSSLNAQEQLAALTHTPTARHFSDEQKNGIIEGRITTTDGQPAAGVSVDLRGTGKGSITDGNGFFQLRNVKPGTHTIVVSFMGLQTREQQIVVKEGATSQLALSLEEDSRQLNEVVVLAQKSLNEKTPRIGKLPVPPRDLPQAITIIDRGILERQQAISMSDILQNVNGVYLSGTTGGVQEEISSRGYSLTGGNNTGSTFKNGARFNNSIAQEFSGVEKVEVLKGGNAILYGNVGAGGVLNIVTKKPKFEQGGSIAFRTGSFDLYKPEFDLYGALGKSQVAAYRINGTYQKAGSFRDGVKSDRFYINPSFLFKLGANTELLVEGDYLNDDRTPDYGTGAINYTVANLPRNTFLNLPWAYNRTEQYMATTTLTHQFSKNISLRGLVSYQRYDNELFSALRPNAGGNMVAADGKWMRGLTKSRTGEDYGYASLDLTAKLQTGRIKHTVLFGGDADRITTDATVFKTYSNALAGKKNIYDTINLFNPATFNTRGDIPYLGEDRVTTSPVARYGLYVQDLVSLSEKVKLLAGIRYSVQHNKQASVDTIGKTTGNIAAFKNDAFSPRLGLVYQPTKFTSLFASYTNSFVVNSGVDVNNQALEPSIINQYEVGMKNDLFHGALTANLTLYQIDNSNLSQPLINPPAAVPTARELSGATRSKGVEVDVMTKTVHGFNIVAGYAFNDMRYTRSVEYVKGSRLRYNPAHTANTSIFYAFEKESKLKGFQLGAGAFYTGKRLAGRSTTVARPDFKLMELPDFVTVDVNAGYVTEAFSVRLKLSNLLNKMSYYAHDDNSVNPIAPRLFAATFAYKF